MLRGVQTTPAADLPMHDEMYALLEAQRAEREFQVSSWIQQVSEDRGEFATSSSGG